MGQPILSVIILSYNTKELTIGSIQSVLNASIKLNIEIIVVDNHSTDGSVEAFKKKFGDKIQIIENNKNLGFSSANNVGIKSSSAQFVLLLNSDTLVHESSLQVLVQTMIDNPTYGIISCTLNNKDGTNQPQGGSVPNIWNILAWWLWPLPGDIQVIRPYQDRRKLGSNRLVEFGWISGAAMLIRRQVFDEIGGLDEKIFMYAEDIDYCIRAQRAGYAVGITSKTSIIHYGSASSHAYNAFFGEVKGLLYIWKKYRSRSSLLALRVIFIIGSLLRLSLFGILKGDKEARRHYVRIINECFHT